MNLKRLLQVLFVSIFFSAFANAEVRIGAELGYAPVDLEAEETAQSIANQSGSTVLTEYSTGVLVGRIFADYEVADNLYGEIGYFQTSGAEATYKIGSDQATEAYDAHGFDFSIKLMSEGIFGKVGMHSTTIDGAANVTIGGTTYSATAEAVGSGILYGGGIEADGVIYSLTQYADVGGITDFTFFSVGFVF